ncbi:MAG: PaaI family thioesterase [Nitrospirales bacterium]|nr:PaaI family thioesterase [Nitrospirales bacterium]
MSGKLEADRHCFVCGTENPFGLKLVFSRAEGKVTSEFIPSPPYQGYKDRVHGGIITSILDEAMIQAAAAAGITSVTAEIRVRFKRPLLIDEEAEIEAEITRRSPRLLEACARMVHRRSGTVLAEASAKLLPVP